MFNIVKNISPLLMIDIITFYISLYLSYITRISIDSLFGVKFPGFAGAGLEFYLHMWWIPLVFVLFMFGEGLYTKRYYFWEELGKIWRAVIYTLFVVFAIVSLGKFSPRISRLLFIYLFTYIFILSPLFRYLGKILFHKINIWQEPVVIIGNKNGVERLIDTLHREKTMGYKVLGIVGIDERSLDLKYPILGKIDDVKDIILKNKLNTVFISLPFGAQDRLNSLIDNITPLLSNIIVVPDTFGLPLFNSEVSYLLSGSIFLIHIKNKLSSLWRRAIKRLFDLVFAITLLPIVLPIMLIIAILIKIESEGPVFYIHKRMGQNGKEILVYKFRSMYQDADKRLNEFLESDPVIKKEWEEYKKIRGRDPRVTRIGRFIRRWSLDELPQLINVIIGNMSIVGPRPYLPREKKDIGEYFDIILLAKPGITGLWQISGRNALTFKDRLKLDAWYVMNWSFWLDIIIVLKTITVVLLRKGAY